eukprot:gene13645-16066_t
MGGSVRAKRRLRNVKIVRDKLQPFEALRLQETVDRMNAHLASQKTNVDDLNIPPEMAALAQAGEVKEMVLDAKEERKEEEAKAKIAKKKTEMKKKNHSSDPDRLGIANEELVAMLSEEELKTTPLLVFANKQDLPGALTDAQVSEGLKLSALKNRQWSIVKTSAIKGVGLYEAISINHENRSSRQLFFSFKNFRLTDHSYSRTRTRAQHLITSPLLSE